MKKEKINPNHHMGKRTGYELINGEYYIAHCYTDEFAELNYKEQGIASMFNGLIEHAQNDMKVIAKQRHDLFATIADDIGIDLSDGNWTYNPYGEFIKKVEKKES